MGWGGMSGNGMQVEIQKQYQLELYSYGSKDIQLTNRQLMLTAHIKNWPTSKK